MARGGPLSRPRIPFRHPFRDEASKEHAVILERRSPTPRDKDGPRPRIPQWSRDERSVSAVLGAGISFLIDRRQRLSLPRKRGGAQVWRST